MASLMQTNYGLDEFHAFLGMIPTHCVVIYNISAYFCEPFGFFPCAMFYGIFHFSAGKKSNLVFNYFCYKMKYITKYYGKMFGKSYCHCCDALKRFLSVLLATRVPDAENLF